MTELTDEQCQEQYAKLKKIDKYAKSLGFTIYEIKAGMNVNENEFLYSDCSTLNKMPEKWANPLFYLDEDDKKICSEINKEIDKLTETVLEKFRQNGLEPSVIYHLRYETVRRITNK